MLNKAALFQALLHPLAISQRGWRALAVAAAKAEPIALQHGVIADGDGDYDEDDPIAIIDVDGPLSKDDSIWQMFFGGTSYAKIRRELDLAIASDAVKAIVFNVNSPGGEVYGCSELANAIYAARNLKPVYAYISGQGDSAAYWIASAADEVIINATAEAGSIGVRCALVDDSEFLASLGIKEYDIVADQSPLKVVDASKEADRARVKQQMTDFASVFVADVARHRSVTLQKVLSDFGRGDVLVGQSAVDAGLADRLGTLEDVIAELSANFNSNEVLMRISKTNANAAAAAPAAQPEAGVSNGKCSKCRADMDDGDPSYCKKCMDGDGDNDGDAKKAKSFLKDVCALVGAEDAATAMGVLVAVKAKAESTAKAADELAALKAEIAALKESQVKGEIESLINAAVTDGRMTPAQRPDFESLAGKYGIEALKAALSIAKPAAAPAQPPKSDDAAAEAAKKNVEEAPAAAAWTNPGAELSPEQMKMLQALKMTPEQFAKAHKNYTAAMNGGVDKE